MSAVYALKYKTRACEPQKAAEDKIRFLFGTANVVEENQIHLVEWDDDDEDVFCVNVYPHASEVVAMASSPTDASLLATSYTKVSGHSVTPQLGIWRMGGDEMHPRLDVVSTLESKGASVALLWEESVPGTLFAVETGGQLRGWDVERGAESMQLALGESLVHVGGAALNPHFSTVLAVCVGDSVLGFDTREASGKPVWRLPGDAEHVRDVDFNPNRPYFLCCGGDAGQLRFWDYRKPDEPVEQRFSGHSHWLTSVAFNPHHDSLVLSSGTDGAVNLYNAKSVSSSVSSSLASSSSVSDYLVSSYDRFSQSVYRAVWSSADAWVYAAVSYDGKALIETVPDKEKMQILVE